MCQQFVPCSVLNTEAGRFGLSNVVGQEIFPDRGMGNANSILDPVFLLVILNRHDINQPRTQLSHAIDIQTPTVRVRLECLGVNRVCIRKFRNCHWSFCEAEQSKDMPCIVNVIFVNAAEYSFVCLIEVFG